jgi:zinc protease
MLDRTIAPPIKDALHFNLTLKPYQFFTLDNGVPVYTIHAGMEDVLQMDMVFYAGNCYEPAGLVAAATNALLRNGTSTKSAFEINECFEYYGAHCNRYCYNETATISLHTLSKHLPHLLPVLQEMIMDSVYPEGELDIYKQNSRQRLMVNLRKCDFVASRLLDAYLFGETHPYGRYSKAEQIEALTAEQLRAYHKAHYANGECVLFVSGKLPADIREQLNNQFGQLPLRAPRINIQQDLAVPATEKKYRIINDENGVQGAIRMGRPFPSRHHPDFSKVMVLNNIFGGFFGSRLMSNIREDKGYTYGIYSYLQNHIQDTAWVISAEAGKDVCEAAVEEIWKEMELLREEPVDAEELLLVQNYMMGTILGDLDGPFHIMSRWKNIILSGVGEDYFYKSIDTIKTITADDIQEMAQRYLQRDAFYDVVVI